MMLNSSAITFRHNLIAKTPRISTLLTKLPTLTTMECIRPNQKDLSAALRIGASRFPSFIVFNRI